MDARIMATSEAAGENLRPTAANYARGGVCYINGRWSEPDDIEFWFQWADGTSTTFSASELRADDWWRSLPEPIALSIEAHLSSRMRSCASRG